MLQPGDVVQSNKATFTHLCPSSSVKLQQGGTGLCMFMRRFQHLSTSVEKETLLRIY